MALFDTHVHLDNQQLTNDTENIIHRAANEGVNWMTAIGTDLPTSLRCVELANQFPDVYAAVGIHPTVCHQSAVTDRWQQIVELTDDPNVVAIGETGLDLYWDKSTIDVQKKWFQHHIDLSFEKQLPLVIHMRECEDEIVSMLESSSIDGSINGIMHSFTGSIQTAQRCLDLGMYISFAGMVTFKKSDQLRSVAAQIPSDRILVETDAPYLSPRPLRTKRPNEPSYMVHTAACLADARDISAEELASITTENAHRVFQLSV